MPHKNSRSTHNSHSSLNDGKKIEQVLINKKEIQAIVARVLSTDDYGSSHAKKIRKNSF
jgi:hypothetical protein